MVNDMSDGGEIMQHTLMWQNQSIIVVISVMVIKL